MFKTVLINAEGWTSCILVYTPHPQNFEYDGYFTPTIRLRYLVQLILKQEDYLNDLGLTQSHELFQSRVFFYWSQDRSQRFEA